MVIVIPVLLLAVTVVFQAMEYYRARQAAETAAYQAVEAARVFGASEADGTAQAHDVLNQLGSPLENLGVAVSRLGPVVTATVTGRPHELVPGLSLRIRASSSGPVERFSPP